MEKRIFTTAEAAEYIGLSAYTLMFARTEKGRQRFKWAPPRHIQTHVGGKVTYLREDLDAWLEAHASRPGRGRKPNKDKSRSAEA